MADIPSFKPAGTVPLSKYGGWLARRDVATGYFHTLQRNGRWWLVDPEGYLFVCMGVNSVSPAQSGRGRGDPQASPPAEEVAWAEQAVGLLRQQGFNTLGCWSDTDAVRKLARPMPYCLRWNFMATYRRQRLKQYPAPKGLEAIYPFDPEFERFCDEHARALAETKDDPWLLGHFSDNELPLHEPAIVRHYLDHPSGDPCHQAAARFLAKRGHDKPARSDDREFLQLVVSEYYRKVASAIRKHDPHHLFLGSRFHGKALASPALMTGAGPHADIVSVNYYHRWTPENDRILQWSRLAGKPILITEWYAQAADSGLPNDTGAGFQVKTQADRAKFYEHFVLSLLKNPGCVGWHWFKYRDSSKNNPGIMNLQDQPYTPLLQAMRRVNTQAYPLVEFLGGR